MAKRAWIVGITALFLPVVGLCGAVPALTVFLMPVAWWIGHIARPFRPLWTVLIVMTSATGFGLLMLSDESYDVAAKAQGVATWLCAMVLVLSAAAFVSRRGWIGLALATVVGIVGSIAAADVAIIVAVRTAKVGSLLPELLAGTAPQWWLSAGRGGQPGHGIGGEAAFTLSDGLGGYATYFLGFAFLAVPFVIALTRTYVARAGVLASPELVPADGPATA